MKLIKILSFIILASNSIYAQEGKGLHYMTLLPIISDLKKEDKQVLIDQVEKMLNDHKIIQYKNNDDFFKVFKKYKTDLRKTLQNKEIIQTVSKKLLVGSLVRIDIKSSLAGYDVVLDIVSQTGEIFYHREKVLYQKSIKLLTDIIKFWIEGYTKKLPFDATIVEVQKSSILVDFPGKTEELFPNRQFAVLRRLTYEAVEDDQQEDFLEIAYGVITKASENSFVGNILQTREDFAVESSDMIIFKIFDEEVAAKNPDYKYRKHDIGNYRNYGKVGLFGSLIQAKGETGTTSFTGALFQADFYLPSKYIVFTEFAKKIGQASDDLENDSTIKSNSLSGNSYKFLAGYTLNPRKWKYISYIDMFAGWSVDQLYFSGLGLPGVGNVTFKGPVIGVRLEHPIYKNFSILSGIDFSISPQFSEEESVLGEAKSTSGYNFQAGVRYRFKNSGFSIEGLFRRKSNKAKLQKQNLILNIKTNQIIMGVTHFF